MWIFGYGSLIFRPQFPSLERRRAFVAGWARRFWQGSPDHRGVPERPGRVATLVRADGEVCGGVAYRVDPERLPSILEALDAREQAGFERHVVKLLDAPDGAPFAEGLVYVAGPDNPHFLGPLPEPEIAAWVHARRGPSGPNAEYVRSLKHALAELAIADAHVDEIVRWLPSHA